MDKMKIVVMMLLIFQNLCLHAHEHGSWLLQYRKLGVRYIPYEDKKWNYCDMKCVQLERLFPNIDFYVVNIIDSIYKPKFSACYGKGADGISHPWNDLVSNEFYARVCGVQQMDYLIDPDFSLLSTRGKGIGNVIVY